MSKYIDFSEVFTKNYCEYSKYVIGNRAIPDLEDGCKPIHKRILWSMYVNNNTWDNKRIKANTAKGLVLGYSPHGDTSVYEAMVRFANDSVNLNLIDGKGAFGSITGRDVQPGADRYVEVRLSEIAKEYLKDIKLNIAGMKDNYDNTKLEPVYMPVTFPAILANPNKGIATGLATNICAFEIGELIDNTINIIDGKEGSIMIPTFSTGGSLIYNKEELNKIRLTGKGSIILRCKYEIKDNSIVITEIPYTTTREAIIEKVISLVKEGKIKDILDINDNTGKNGLKITIDLKKNCNKEFVLSQLLSNTTLQDSFNCNFTVLDNGFPKTLGTDDIIKKWILFRQKCITNKLLKDIKNKQSKLNILSGLKNVLLDIDKAINIIRKDYDAKNTLIKEFSLNEEQSEYILNMKLRNINKDYIIKQIKDIDCLNDEVEFLNNNINNIDYINSLIKDDLLRVKKLYSYKRKTDIIYEDDLKPLSKQSLIEDYNCRIAYTPTYIKKYKKVSEDQKIKEDEQFIELDIQSNNKDTLLIFTDKANRYRISVNDLGGVITPSKSYGVFIPSIVKLEPDEKIIKIVSIGDNAKGNMIFAFDNGKVAKVDIKSYLSANKKLLNCFNTNCKLLDLAYVECDTDIIMVSEEGKGLIFNTSKINSKASRNTQGNTAMKADRIISAKIGITQDNHIELITNKGRNKEILLDDVAETGKKNEERSWLKYLYGRIGNCGSFIINCRSNNDSIKSVKFI